MLSARHHQHIKEAIKDSNVLVLQLSCISLYILSWALQMHFIRLGLLISSHELVCVCVVDSPDLLDSVNIRRWKFSALVHIKVCHCKLFALFHIVGYSLLKCSKWFASVVWQHSKGCIPKSCLLNTALSNWEVQLWQYNCGSVGIQLCGIFVRSPSVSIETPPERAAEGSCGEPDLFSVLYYCPPSACLESWRPARSNHVTVTRSREFEIPISKVLKGMFVYGQRVYCESLLSHSYSTRVNMSSTSLAVWQAHDKHE